MYQWMLKFGYQGTHLAIEAGFRRRTILGTAIRVSVAESCIHPELSRDASSPRNNAFEVACDVEIDRCWAVVMNDVGGGILSEYGRSRHKEEENPVHAAQSIRAEYEQIAQRGVAVPFLPSAVITRTGPLTCSVGSMIRGLDEEVLDDTRKAANAARAIETVLVGSKRFYHRAVQKGRRTN